jgi:hypothetical protein
MLLNEFPKQHRRNEEQAVTISRLEQIEALTIGLQKVSDNSRHNAFPCGYQLNKAKWQTVLNAE